MPKTRTTEDRLRLFADKVDEMLDRRAVRDKTVKAHFTMTGSAESTSMTFDTGDHEDLRSLLVAFRPFTAPNEDVFANDIFDALERHLTDAEMREAALHNHEVWRFAMRGPMMLVVNDKQFQALDCFKLVANGDLFHHDEKKAAEYAALPEFMQRMVFGQMTGLVMDGMRALGPTRYIIVKAFEGGHLKFD